eukprot:TRINITY_DN9682_c0_g1_i1.p1 TRINITY_DN9682_c0_g1~~TRINITY_DN9682_c0_g1_i1.p1  ORF type:complete len:484 (+),score=136.45 TRINITY_DN9682_c0_g1_i1:36-1487(+)
MNDFSKLPPDVMNLLFGNLIEPHLSHLLPKYQHLINFGSSCHHLRILMFGVFLESYTLKSEGDLIFLRDNLKDFKEKIKSLCFSKNPLLDWRDIIQKVDIVDILKGCQRLRVLNVANLRKFPREILESRLLFTFQKLKSIHINAGRMDEKRFLIFLKNVPFTVTSIGLEDIDDINIKVLATHIFWLEQFSFKLQEFEPELDTNIVSNLNKAFKLLVKNNPKIMKLIHLKEFKYCSEVDWEAIKICNSLNKLEFGFTQFTFDDNFLHSKKAGMTWEQKVLLFENFNNPIQWILDTRKTDITTHIAIIKQLNISHFSIQSTRSIHLVDYLIIFQDIPKLQILKSLSLTGKYKFYDGELQLVSSLLNHFSNLQKFTSCLELLKVLEPYGTIPSVKYLSVEITGNKLKDISFLVKWIPQLKLLKIFFGNQSNMKSYLRQIKKFEIVPPFIHLEYTTSPFSEEQRYDYCLKFQKEETRSIVTYQEYED